MSIDPYFMYASEFYKIASNVKKTADDEECKGVFYFIVKDINKHANNGYFDISINIGSYMKDVPIHRKSATCAAVIEMLNSRGFKLKKLDDTSYYRYNISWNMK